MTNSKHNSVLVFLFGVVSLPILTIGYLYYTGYFDILEPGNLLQVLSIVTTSLLSAALVYLYFQQKEVLENQVSLKRSEMGGSLYVNTYSFTDESVKVKLSNLSGSEISGLQLFTEIFPKEIQGKSLGVRGKPLQRAESNESQFGRLVGIAPREQSVSFTATPSVFYVTEDGTERIPELTFFITELRDEGVEKVQCRMWVEGEDQLGDKVKAKVLRWDKSIQIDTDKGVAQEPDLEEVFKRAGAGSIDDAKSQF